MDLKLPREGAAFWSVVIANYFYIKMFIGYLWLIKHVGFLFHCFSLKYVVIWVKRVEETTSGSLYIHILWVWELVN